MVHILNRIFNLWKLFHIDLVLFYKFVILNLVFDEVIAVRRSNLPPHLCHPLRQSLLSSFPITKIGPHLILKIGRQVINA
jgi:hypothetical protein